MSRTSMPNRTRYLLVDETTSPRDGGFPVPGSCRRTRHPPAGRLLGMTREPSSRSKRIPFGPDCVGGSSAGGNDRFPILVPVATELVSNETGTFKDLDFFDSSYRAFEK